MVQPGNLCHSNSSCRMAGRLAEQSELPLYEDDLDIAVGATDPYKSISKWARAMSLLWVAILFFFSGKSPSFWLHDKFYICSHVITQFLLNFTSLKTIHWEVLATCSNGPSMGLTPIPLLSLPMKKSITTTKLYNWSVVLPPCCGSFPRTVRT